MTGRRENSLGHDILVFSNRAMNRSGLFGDVPRSRDLFIAAISILRRVMK